MTQHATSYLDKPSIKGSGWRSFLALLHGYQKICCCHLPSISSGCAPSRHRSSITGDHKHCLKKENVLEMAQRCFRQFPTIILGSGASVDYGLPITSKIEEHIQEQSKTWEYKMKGAVKKCLRKHKFLENALDELQNTNSDAYMKTIALIWYYINNLDIRNFESLKDKNYSVGNLLLEMFESNQKCAHIITTNYDRVVEYICHVNGLNYQIEFPENGLEKVKNINAYADPKLCASRVVFIHKVHGSLSWFKTQTDKTVNMPTTNEIPSGCHPLIVPPGITKYKLSHQEPFRTIQRGADNVIENSTSFLFSGFGFNDEHIQHKIEQVCSNRNIPIVFLAEELSENARKFLDEKAGKNYMGIEKNEEGSKVYTPDFPDGEPLSVPGLWSISGFCKMVLPERRDDSS